VPLWPNTFRDLRVLGVLRGGALKYRELGRTGLKVSAISLGTVSLGLDYGIQAPGQFGRPDELSAIRLLRQAADRGITLIDTAPAYGTGERLVGCALGANARTIIATKVTPPADGMDVRAAITASLDASRLALGRETLDIVQIHNATVEMIAKGDVTEALALAKRRGQVRFVGTSVYDEAAAMAAVTCGQFDLVQIAFNALDQRMAANVLPAADKAGIGVIVRSALLKGALTSKAQWLSGPLERLRTAAEQARDLLADGSWEALPKAAMRFCLSFPSLSSVLVGARTSGELEVAVQAEAEGPLSERLLQEAARLGLDEEQLLNPSYWPVP
jgi:aryl-alcohol dehydrogenase-like predicted oxidoreductase